MTDATDPLQSASQLLAVLGELARELQPGRVAMTPTLDSNLERDLGFDSLGRTELILRLERTFEVSLPDRALVAETARDLLRAVLASSGVRPARVAELRIQPPVEAGASVPADAATLLHALTWHAETHPDRIHVHIHSEDDPLELSYGDLRRQAGAIALGLQEKGLESGQTVGIMLPTGAGYLFSFLGTLMAGGIPVPIYPPWRPSQVEEHLRRHARILQSAESVMLITTPEAVNFARLLKPHLKELRQVLTVDALSHTGQASAIFSPKSQDLRL